MKYKLTPQGKLIRNILALTVLTILAIFIVYWLIMWPWLLNLVICNTKKIWASAVAVLTLVVGLSVGRSAFLDLEEYPISIFLGLLAALIPGAIVLVILFAP